MPLKINDLKMGSNISRLELKESNVSREISKEFVQSLDKLTKNDLENKLQNLLADIEAQSKKIEKNLNLSEIIKYKKLVKDFLNLSINYSHKFSKENFLDRRGRHRIMSIIRKVDTELEKLTQDFLKKEKDKLKILNRMDGIRGLLLDILL